MTLPTKIPDDSDWYGYEGNLDVSYIRDLFYGKSNEEVQEYFGENRSIERAVELLSCPRAVFQYKTFGKHAVPKLVRSQTASDLARQSSQPAYSGRLTLVRYAP